MDPITLRINIITGNNCFECFIFSINEYVSSDIGIFFLLIIDHITTYDIKISAIIIPGIIPAIKSLAIDSEL